METSFIIKLIVLAVIFFILLSLGFGLYYLFTNKGKSKKTVKALAVRIGLSLFLFIALFVAFYFGWISPHAINQISN